MENGSETEASDPFPCTVRQWSIGVFDVVLEILPRQMQVPVSNAQPTFVPPSSNRVRQHVVRILSFVQTPGVPGG